MKKHAILYGFLISLLCLTSCSDKEDSNSETPSIIGVWKPIKEVSVCSTGSEQVYEYSICEQTGRTIFNKNGTFSVSAYDITEGNCELYYSDVTGTWEQNGDVLTLTTNVQTKSPTLFELTNNKLLIGYDSNPNTTCDGENLPSHYYTEFIRVE